MRWATFCENERDERVGLVVGDRVYTLAAGVALIDLIADGDSSLRAAERKALSAPAAVASLAEVELLPPVPRPPSVRDFMAFENHYRDTREGLGLAVEPVFYEQPCFYFSNPAAITGPDAAIPLAPGTAKFDFELEIAVIIGRPGRNLAPEEAEAHIAGYAVLCDWSARDLQAKETVFGTGPAKGKDTVTSLGPYLVTPDELEPFRTAGGYDLSMTATVNGVPYSAGNWATIYWTVPELLAFASRGTELRTGDVIGTGTVGTGSIMELAAVHGSDRFPWLKAGDEVYLSVARLGDVRGRIVEGDTVQPLRRRQMGSEAVRR